MEAVHTVDAFFYVFCVKMKGREYMVVDIPYCVRKQHEEHLEASFENARQPLGRVASLVDLRLYPEEKKSSKVRQCMSLLL